MKHTFRFLAQKINGSWQLRESELHHALKVVQLQKDDEFEMTDGNGSLAYAIVLERSKKDLVYEVKSETHTEAASDRIDLYGALLKPGVFDDVLPYLVELGVGDIHLYAQDGGELKRINDKVQARWQRIIDEAMKQSKRLYEPRIQVYESFAAAFVDSPEYDAKFMLDETIDTPSSSARISGKIALLIGSSSGLSEQTRQSAAANKFVAVSIARNILRSQTAFVAGLAIFGQMQL